MAATKRSAGELALPDLVGAVAELLASGYGGVRSGRIRDLPDARTVRWYQTLGMVDRPAAFQGRTALYGRRHVLQLAAIKKLQSSGLPLAEIQRGLAGRTDGELARSAGVTLKDVDQAVARAVRGRPETGTDGLGAAVAGDASPKSRRDTAFWKSPPATAERPLLVPSVPRGMQSVRLGEVGMLLWSGRPLTAAERSNLDRLGAPLIAFLQSVQRSTAGIEADDAPAAAPLPVGRDKESAHDSPAHGR